MNDLDETARDAEHIADELREYRLMTLAVIMRAGENGDVARGIDTDRGAFEQTTARTKPARNARRGEAAGFNVCDDADAAQLAAPSRLVAPGRKASLRSATHLTGRSSLRAAQVTNASSA